MSGPEDYSRARKLATVEHLGTTFHVVRRRFNGKPWRKYLTLVHAGYDMAEATWDRYGTDPQQAAELFKQKLARTFPTDKERPYMLGLIAELKAKQDRQRPAPEADASPEPTNSQATKPAA